MLVVNCADLVFVRLPVGTTVWDRALQRLSDAVEGIESRISVSAACQKDLDALSAAGGPGLSLAGIQDKLATVDLQNGPRSNAPLAVLSRDPMNLAETQHSGYWLIRIVSPWLYPPFPASCPCRFSVPTVTASLTDPSESIILVE